MAVSSKTPEKLQPGFGLPLGAEIKAGFIWKTAGSQTIGDHAYFVRAEVIVHEQEDESRRWLTKESAGWGSKTGSGGSGGRKGAQKEGGVRARKHFQISLFGFALRG